MRVKDKLKIEYVPTESLNPYPNNAKIHTSEQVQQIMNSIEMFGFNDPIAVWKDNEIIEGHGRLMAANELGMKEVPIIHLDELSDEERRAYMLTHNQLTMNTGFEIELLQSEIEVLDIDMQLLGFDMKLDRNEDDVAHYTLEEVFVAPPFSILDTRQGYWQNRKKQWLSLGIRSELGRDDNLSGAPDMPEYATNKMAGIAPQTSVFDPVLTEIMYKWFNVEGGLVFDCFAGGSVRGVIAEKTGFKYIGIDLRQEQVDANYEQAIQLGVNPVWYCDDSLNADKYIKDGEADLLFTCRP